ncbi:RNA 2',3'-cyclic phosphodiesterase [bacterium]|nr:RNA 2',3'-cyclic phosphodiesterase [bacterium]
MSLRLFAAIAIPDEISDALVQLQRDLPGAAWRPREAFHLTLSFFGEIDEPVARDLDEEIAGIVAGPFQMRLASVGSFGGRQPTAVWAGVDAPPVLKAIAAGCERAARRVGLKPDGRAYTPHVTLAYCEGTTDVDVARYHERFSEFRSDRFWVDHFALFSSRPTKRTRAYVEEAVYPLTGLPEP